MKRCLEKARIRLDPEKLHFTPLVSEQFPVYEDEREIYNILFEEDVEIGGDVPSVNGTPVSKMDEMLNAPGSALKKRKHGRKRWKNVRISDDENDGTPPPKKHFDGKPINILTVRRKLVID